MTMQLSLFSGEGACLVKVGLDDFKAVNDNHGHPAGDAVLTMLARILLRTYPRQTDFVARYAENLSSSYGIPPPMKVWCSRSVG